MVAPIAPILKYSSFSDAKNSQKEFQSRYENNSAILLEDAGVLFDRDFFSVVSMPEKYKKIGTMNGVTLAPFVLKDGVLVRNKKNSLSNIIKHDNFLSKVVYEFHNIEIQLTAIIAKLFPGVKKGNTYNCTFRLVPTRSEGLHFDYFSNGAPLRVTLPKLE